MNVSGLLQHDNRAVTHTQELMDKTYLACRYADQRTKQDWMLQWQTGKIGRQDQNEYQLRLSARVFVFIQLVALSLTPSMLETAFVAICAFLSSPAVRRPPRFVDMANTTSF